MNQLFKHSDAPVSNSYKYFLNCPSIVQTGNWIKQLEKIYTTKEQAIIKALLNHNNIRKKQVVIKLGTKNTIDHEYTVGKILSSIPGFIKYICKTECYDDITKYSNITNSTVICSNSKNDELVHLLIMPYIPQGSMRGYNWENNINVFRACFKQLIASLVVAFNTYGFLHMDIHLGNVLIKHTKKKSIEYSDINIIVETCGHEIVIMDFEHAFIGVDRSDTMSFYKDILRIINEITLVLNLEFDEMQYINQFVMKRCYERAKIEDVFTLFKVIDRMKFIGKRKPRSLVYDPTNY